MKALSVFGQIVIGLLIGTFLSLALLVGMSYGAEIVYKFKPVDIPLHFMFHGQQREDIVRLTDLNNKGDLFGNNFASEGYFVTKQKVTEVHCPGDVADIFDNNSTTVSAVNNSGQIVGSCSDNQRNNASYAMTSGS
jgi:hypothetical protein